jgi:hypothetical protein
MNNGIVRFSILVSLCLAFVAGSAFAAAKVPDGYRDIKLGMSKAQVLSILQKSPLHFSYDDLGGQIGEIIRGDNLFRYATYTFDNKGALVQIGLQMREVVGRTRCIKIFNSEHGLKLSPLQSTVQGARIIELHNNSVVLRKFNEKDTRSAKRGPS